MESRTFFFGEIVEVFLSWAEVGLSCVCVRFILKADWLIIRSYFGSRPVLAQVRGSLVDMQGCAMAALARPFSNCRASCHGAPQPSLPQTDPVMRVKYAAKTQHYYCSAVCAKRIGARTFRHVRPRSSGLGLLVTEDGPFPVFAMPASWAKIASECFQMVPMKISLVLRCALAWRPILVRRQQDRWVRLLQMQLVVPLWRKEAAADVTARNLENAMFNYKAAPSRKPSFLSKYSTSFHEKFLN